MMHSRKPCLPSDRRPAPRSAAREWGSLAGEGGGGGRYAMGYELSISGALADSPTQYFSNTGELKPELKVGGCVDALVLPGAD